MAAALGAVTKVVATFAKAASAFFHTASVTLAFFLIALSLDGCRELFQLA